MPLPLSKQELADWILRRLGAPMVNVEIADVQLEDVIDEAVQFFQEYHYDGAERAYRTLKISSDVINGNDRIHQNLNAPMYDVTLDKKYRLGDRVMTYKRNGLADKVWVRFDSDETATYKNFVQDNNGDWFVKDSDVVLIDFKHLFDSEARDHEDSDGVYVLYDSDTHNIVVYYSAATSQFYYSEQSDSYKPDSESFVLVNGTYVSYDSDTHVRFVYDSDAAGLWVDSDNDKVLFDATNPEHFETTYIPWDSDSSVTYVFSNGQYVLYDSDTHATFTYVQDITGGYVREEGTNRFVPDTTDPVYQLPGVVKYKRIANAPDLYEQLYSPKQRYARQNARPVNIYLQANEIQYVDSEGEYVVYDSDKHFTWAIDPTGEYVFDSENNSMRYDSNLHVLKYVIDSDNGSRVLVGGNYIQYDSENHSTLQRYRVENFEREVYESDLSGESGYWVFDVINNTYVPYDSDMYSTVTYESDAAGGYVDSDGVIKVYNSTIYAVYGYDSDYSRTDSDGTTYRKIDSEGDLAGLYVLFETDSENYYELYDSDKHIGIFMDSDGLGQQVDFGINLNGRIFKRTISFTPVQRFRKVTRTTVVQRYNLVYYPYVRYNKVQNSDKFFRRTEPLGQRYTLTYTRDVRFVGSSFNDYWKEEDLVLTEPVVDYDYSKQGQVGIPVPDTIIGINKVFRIDNFSGMGMWNYEYQYFLNNFDFFYGNGGASSMPMSNYMITKSYMDLIDNMMNVQPAIRFNKTRNRLYIDTSWTRIKNMAKSKDYYLMIECYEVNDPEVFGDVYKDKWLKRYATALAKMQWGSNLKKYSNTELPGGLTIDGQALYDEGKAEADELTEELKSSQLEMDFLIG